MEFRIFWRKRKKLSNTYQAKLNRFNQIFHFKLALYLNGVPIVWGLLNSTSVESQAFPLRHKKNKLNINTQGKAGFVPLLLVFAVLIVNFRIQKWSKYESF
jgi:hypothetical protein